MEVFVTGRTARQNNHHSPLSSSSPSPTRVSASSSTTTTRLKKLGFLPASNTSSNNNYRGHEENDDDDDDSNDHANNHHHNNNVQRHVNFLDQQRESYFNNNSSSIAYSSNNNNYHHQTVRGSSLNNDTSRSRSQPQQSLSSMSRNNNNDGHDEDNFHHQTEFHDVSTLIPPAPSFYAERLALLRHLKEVPPQVTHSTSTNDDSGVLPSSPLKGITSSSPMKTLKPGSPHGSFRKTSSSATATAKESISVGDDELLFDLPSVQKQEISAAVLTTVQEEAMRRNEMTIDYFSSLFDKFTEFQNQKLKLRERTLRNEVEQESRALLLNALRGGGRGEEERTRNQKGQRYISADTLVEALEEVHQHRLRDTLELLDKMESDLKRSKSKEKDLQEQLDELKIYHIDTVNYMNRKAEAEKDFLLKQSEEQMLNRIKKLAKRVRSQDQEIIGTLRELSGLNIGGPGDNNSEQHEPYRSGSAYSTQTTTTTRRSPPNRLDETVAGNSAASAEQLALKVLEQALLPSSSSMMRSSSASRLTSPRSHSMSQTQQQGKRSPPAKNPENNNNNNDDQERKSKTGVVVVRGSELVSNSTNHQSPPSKRFEVSTSTKRRVSPPSAQQQFATLYSQGVSPYFE